MTGFPTALTDPRARAVAQTLLDGFDRHYRLFRETSAAAKWRFETADWAGQQRAQRERIAYYDIRVGEAVARLQGELAVAALPMDVWQQVKLHYIGLLIGHHQPELAETFFNSVTTKLLHRRYFHNDFIFVRPALSIEYIENDEPASLPTYRAYYPTRETLAPTFARIVDNFQLACPFEDLARDVDRVLAAVLEQLGDDRLAANFQVQVLSSLFYRNQGAYVVGKIIDGYRELPFALAILHAASGRLRIDAALFGEDDLQLLFSFTRAYFMVAMEVPSAYVQFLRSLMPTKPRSEIYISLGLAKQGKNAYYRDFLLHLRHSTDRFRIAPGTPGMVMLVFDLPSFPYVFKVIKDVFPAHKRTTREAVKGKYRLVKQHDRVGRMADTLEYSDVAFPLARFDPELLAQLRRDCPSLLEADVDALVIRHLYIERRMIPLDIYLRDAAAPQAEAAVIEYGAAIKDLAHANVFPGDLRCKNFGLTRHGKVVFYDYDEIEYLTDCRFLPGPATDPPADEDAGVPGTAGARTLHPQAFDGGLLGDPGLRAVFMKYHADLLDAGFWQGHQQRVRAGDVHDVLPYEAHKRLAPAHRPAATDMAPAGPAAPGA